MSKQVKRRRGTTTEHGSFVGSAGELTVDTTLNTAVVHDGSQTGGYPLCKADLSNADLSNKISVAELNVADGISGQVLSTNGSGSLIFINSGSILSNSVGIVELDVTDGTVGQYLTTDGSGNLSFSTDNTNVGTTAVGGDVTGTVSNIQIAANAVDTSEIATNAVGITELNVSDGTVGQYLTTDGSGTLSFSSPSGIGANSVGIVELNVSDGTVGQYLTTDGSGNLSFSTDNTNVGGTSVGGDVTGTVSNIQIGTGTVGITELNVTDGSSGELLSTNGSGVLSFLPQLTSLAVGGGILTGTTNNAGVANSSILNAMLATGIDASKLTGTIPSSVGGTGGTFTGSFTRSNGSFNTGSILTITGCPFTPTSALFINGPQGQQGQLGSVGGGTPGSQQLMIQGGVDPQSRGGLSGVSILVRDGSGNLQTVTMTLSTFTNTGCTLQQTGSGSTVFNVRYFFFA